MRALITHTAVLVAACSLVSVTAYAEPAVVTTGQYRVVSQTLLPHLEEMRRLHERSERCIDAARPARLFPVMDQPGLRACVLAVTAAPERFRLACDGNNGASGTAWLRRDGNAIRATLDAKMGGKNMTFTQEVTATRIGDCGVAQDALPTR